jgi:hypothetical protein
MSSAAGLGRPYIKGEKASPGREPRPTCKVSNNRLVCRILLALIIVPAGLLSWPGAVSAESWVSEYPRVAALAEQDCKRGLLSECRRALLRVAALLDNRTDVLYRLAKVEAKLGHVEASMAYLKSYADSQLDFGDPEAQPEFQAMRTRPDFQKLERVYRAGLRPTGAYLQLAVAPAADLVAEDLALDTDSGIRYLSSVHLGKVLALDTAGHWSDVAQSAELSAWGIYALAVDVPRARLWISSVAGRVSPPFRGLDKGRSAVLRLNLASHALEQRYELQDGRPHAFGDMALGMKGELYISDGEGGGVYRIGAEPDSQMLSCVSPGELRSPQSPVPLPGGSRVLVADYSRGIAIINVQSGQGVSWLRHGPELALYGIDGLYRYGQNLIAVQNGTAPERLLIMRLDPSFTRVVEWHVALARAPGLGDPTHGIVLGNKFEFISNSGWDRVDDQGNLKPAAAAKPALWSIELPD